MHHCHLWFTIACLTCQTCIWVYTCSFGFFFFHTYLFWGRNVILEVVIFCFCFCFLVYYGSIPYYCYDDAISFLLLYTILLCRLGYPLFQVIYHLQRETWYERCLQSLQKNRPVPAFLQTVIIDKPVAALSENAGTGSTYYDGLKPTLHKALQ